MLTQNVEGGGDGPALKVTETIVRNVRVTATDQRIDNKDKDGKVQVKTFANVTFEVTPRIAEKIAVAALPRHAVAPVRSPTMVPSWSVRLPPATSRSPAGASPAQEKQMLMAAVVRSTTPPSARVGTCRFQRRSVPSKPQVQWRLPLRVRRWSNRFGKSSGVRVVRGNSVNNTGLSGSSLRTRNTNSRACLGTALAALAVFGRGRRAGRG